MKKKSFCVVLIIVIFAFALTCMCSCKQEPFNYDWSDVDALMEDIGVENNLHTTSGDIWVQGTKLNIFYDKNEDVEVIFSLTRYNNEPFSHNKQDYYLEFNIHYYNLIPEIIVASHFQWHFASTDPDDWSSVYASLSYFINGEEKWENYRFYKEYAINNLQLNDEQFESCEYVEIPLFSSEERIGHLELEHSDEYYLNYLLSEGFKATTEFFENYNLKSLYRYTERIPQTITTI